MTIAVLLEVLWDGCLGRSKFDLLRRLVRELGQVADQTFLMVAGFAIDVQKIGVAIDRHKFPL